MATRKETVSSVLAALDNVGSISARAMFGEFAVYCGGKVVALVCDDTFYLKPTPAGGQIYPDAEFGLPYPGAKPHIIVPEDRWDDAKWFGALVRATADALPMPKPKTTKLR